MKDYLFLYGTLLTDQAAAATTAEAFRSLGPAWVLGKLYDLGEYPGALLVPSSNSKIHGEVFELSSASATLKALDQYEEFDPENEPDSLFVRTRVRANLTSGNYVDCWMYVYNRDPGTAPILADGVYSKTRAA